MALCYKKCKIQIAPFILEYCREVAFPEDDSLVFDSSVALVGSGSISGEVLDRSVVGTVRCHAGILGGAAGVEPTIGEGNCFLCWTRNTKRKNEAKNTVIRSQKL